MFIAQTIRSKTLRSVRSEICFQPANAPSCCAPTEREPNSLTFGYKHLAPLGRNPQHQLVALPSEAANEKCEMRNGKSSPFLNI